MKDDEDRALEALFVSAPVADNGFSGGVERRIRRQMLLRRTTLSVAVALGSAFAGRPVLELGGLLHRLTAGLTGDVLQAFASPLSTVSLVLAAAALTAAALVFAAAMDE